MRKIIFIICCLFSVPAFSQYVEDNVEVRSWLDNMFKNIDKSKVPSGLLRDYAFEMADLDIYNGKELNDSNYVNRTAFENLLRTIRSSAVGTKPFDAEEVLAAQYALAGKNKGVMGVILYQYSYIRADALTNHLIRYENEQVFDNVINGIWQNPYATGYTLGFSAQDTTFYGSTVHYSFPTTIWKSNITPNSVEFDADDGRGYVAISKGGSYSVRYNAGGVKKLKMRVKLATGNYLYSHSLAKVVSDEVLTRAANEALRADFTMDIEAVSSYNGNTAKGRISFLYSRIHPGRLSKPFIIMEGFDPLEFVEEGKEYMGDKNYGNTNIETFVNYLKWNYNAYQKLRDEYDIIYIDLFDSKIDIQANAKLFERAMEIINQKKVQDGCSEKNIVLGQSMGGLIARYGLKEMENNHKIHDVSLLFCQDTPHLGAHVPLGVLQGMNGLLRFYYDKKIIGRLTLGDLKSKVAPILYCNAAKQMLINYVDDDGNIDNSFHNAWQKELTQMGYPQGDNGYKMRVVSISNGQTQVVKGNTPYIYVDGYASTTLISSMFLDYFLPHVTAIALGIVLQDWQVFMIGLLPGSSTLKLHFEATPIGYQNGRSVCNMYLRYIKKFLWVVKVQRTVFSYQRDYPLSMINYDIMPGSYYQLSTVKGSTTDESQADWWVKFLAKYNLQTSFGEKIMFIPTVSSLDIGEGKVELTQSDYEKKYLMDFPPVSPKHTPFEAFYITEGSTYHTSFEPTMLEWMMEQMKVTIDGPNVAIDGSKYVIRNNTRNYTTTWSSSDESVATIDNTGTLVMKKYGVITITASCVINNVTTKIPKKIMVGFPPFVLDWYMDNVYMIRAKCIDPKAEPFLKYIQYEWKAKSSTTEGNWIQSAVPEKGMSTSQKAMKLTIYMRAFNAEGVRGNPIFLSLDVTAPFEFYPSRETLEVNSYTNPNSFSLEFFPNPEYEDQEALKNNDQFQVRYVNSMPNASSGNTVPSIGFYPASTNGRVLLNDCWRQDYFLSWYRMISRGEYGSTPEVMTVLLFKNKYEKVIYRKLIRVRYFRY